VPDSASHFDWDERLQDWIDGDLDPAASAELEAHITGCDSCQARLRAFRAVDAALSGSLTRQTLPASFDCAVLERVHGAAKAGRAAARARLEQAWQAEIGAFSRQWRTALRSMILNALLATALLAAFLTRLPGWAPTVRLTDQIGQFTLYASSRPALTVVLLAAAMSVVALGLTRAFGERP
jgi:anti-sigma factor RsiW